MAFDKLKFHVEDAGSEERAAGHMAVFVLWAAGKGFLSETHEPARIVADPVRYIIESLQTLADSDFTDEGLAFARAHYVDYVEYLTEHAMDAGISAYDYIATQAGRRDMVGCLDEALAEFHGLFR